MSLAHRILASIPTNAQITLSKNMAGVYLGAAVPNSTAVELDTFASGAGKKPYIIMDYRDWVHTITFPSSLGDFIYSRGGIMEVTWEPWDYTGGITQNSFTLTSIINGEHDQLISQWAQGAKSWGKPFLLRFAHEMNGNFYPWSEGVNTNTTGQYVEAWRYVVDVFRTLGVNNVTWVWCPNVEYTGSTPLAGLYPGDNYVDWSGLDGYNFGTTTGHVWQSFSQLYASSITSISAVAIKPFMIGEIGCSEVGGDKAAWITDMYQQIGMLTQIKAFTWFDYNKETDWRINSSVSAQSAFANGISSSNYYAGR